MIKIRGQESETDREIYRDRREEKGNDMERNGGYKEEKRMCKVANCKQDQGGKGVIMIRG